MDNISNEENLSISSSGGGIDWSEYLYAVKKRLWLVALTTILGFGCSIVYLARTTPVYAARSLLQIDQKAAQVVRMDSVETTDARYLDVLNTLVETIHSRTLLLRVVDNLNLSENADFLPKSANGMPYSKGDALNVLSGCIKVGLRKNTRLVDVVAEHQSPEIARLLADAIAKEFIRFGNDQRLASSQSANEFISDEVGKLREKLRRAEEALQKFPEVMNTGPLDQAVDIYTDQLKDFSARFSTARGDRIALETDQTRATENENTPAELLKLPSIVKQPMVAPLLATLMDRESNLIVLGQQYKSKHPKYITAVAEIESLKASLNQKAMEAAGLLATACAIARDNEAKLEKSMHDQELVLAERNRKMLDYKVMKRDYDADRALYESMQARMKEIDVTKGIDGSPIKIVDSAIASGVPVRPNRLQSMTLGSLLGLGSGILGAIGINMVRRRLRTVTQVENLIGLPVLGALEKRMKAGGESDRDFLLQTKGVNFEVFRALQASIAARVTKEKRRTIMVTSATPGEGKTYVSANLAIAFAQSGHKTLLIDADLHKCTFSRILGADKNQPGFMDVLGGHARLEDAILPGEMPGLYYLTCGLNSQNPALLLTPAALQTVFDGALKEFDQIIIDTPPVLALSDSLIIAAKAQTVCFVVASGLSRCKAVQRACKMLLEVGNPPLGIAVNSVAKDWDQVGYYKGYYGYYGEADVKSGAKAQV